MEVVKKSNRKKQLCTERRFTRSQTKIDRSSSQDTTESIRKIAEDALEIGRIIGVTLGFEESWNCCFGVV